MMHFFVFVLIFFWLKIHENTVMNSDPSAGSLLEQITLP